jgi:hypothetical protein
LSSAVGQRQRDLGNKFSTPDYFKKPAWMHSHPNNQILAELDYMSLCGRL